MAKKRLSRRKFIKRALIGGTALATVDALWLEHFFVDFNHYSMNGAEQSDASIKVVQLTDLHLESFGYSIKRAIGYVNELKPDLICFTGDMIDKEGKLPEVEKLLQYLDLSVPKVAIFGNWEYWSGENLNHLKELYKKYNVHLLANDGVQLAVKNTTFHFTGLDDDLAMKSDYAKAERFYTPSDYHIILNHCPQYNDEIQMLNTFQGDLILSGHTHGGQISLFGWAPGLPPKSGRFVSGWYRDKKIPVYVCKGLGTSVLPVRFGARAEVAIFYFTPK